MDEAPRRRKPEGQKVSSDEAPPARRKPVERRPPVTGSAAATPTGAKPAAARPAAARPAPAKPAAAKPAVPKPAPKKVVEEEEDDFSSLAPRKASSRELPPKVVKKKKAEKAVSERRRASSGGPFDPAEVLVPVILIVAGLALNVAAALIVKPWWAPNLTPGYLLGIRFALLGVSTVAAVGVLFLAAAGLDISYGLLHTAILKAIAITLTHAWVGDFSSLIEIRFIEWAIAFGTTYAMFKYLFELDDSEAITSTIVVRLVYWVIKVFAVAAIFAALFSGKISIPEGMIDPAAIEADEGDMEDDSDFDMDGAENPQGMNPQGVNPQAVNPQGGQAIPPNDGVEE